jgi:hypothetical protein
MSTTRESLVQKYKAAVDVAGPTTADEAKAKLAEEQRLLAEEQKNLRIAERQVAGLEYDVSRARIWSWEAFAAGHIGIAAGSRMTWGVGAGYRYPVGLLGSMEFQIMAHRPPGLDSPERPDQRSILNGTLLAVHGRAAYGGRIQALLGLGLGTLKHEGSYRAALAPEVGLRLRVRRDTCNSCGVISALGVSLQPLITSGATIAFFNFTLEFGLGTGRDHRLTDAESQANFGCSFAGEKRPAAPRETAGAKAADGNHEVQVHARR